MRRALFIVALLASSVATAQGFSSSPPACVTGCTLGGTTTVDALTITGATDIQGAISKSNGTTITISEHVTSTGDITAQGSDFGNGTTAPLVITGGDNDDSAAIGVRINTTNPFTVLGGKILTLETGSTEKLSVRLDGALDFLGVVTGSLSTCNAGSEGTVQYDSTTKTVKWCNATAWASMSGASTGVLPSMTTSRRISTWQLPSIGNSTLTGYGITSPSALAGETGSKAAYDVTVFTTRGSSRMRSGTSSGNFNGTKAVEQMYFDGRPRATFLVATGASVADVRLWAVAHGATGYEAEAAPTTRHFGFRFDTSAGDTNWMCSTADGTTHSATSTGVAVAANTIYSLTADYSTSGRVYCYVNSTTVSTEKTSNLPTGVATIPGLQVSVTTLTTAARDLYLAYLELEQN